MRRSLKKLRRAGPETDLKEERGMKRGIITLLAVLFLAFPAQARTREAVYTAEGEEETVV